MLAYIEGELVEKTPTYAIIDIGGVGYMIHISLNTFSKLVEKGRCRLYTHLAIKEDAHTLYGFSDENEKKIFRQLISVSGVGTSTARMILSSLTTEEIQTAISTGNVALLRKVKGIGEKSAQRIIVDLKDKIEKDTSVKDFSFIVNNNIKIEALSALIHLGFNKNSAEKAIDRVYNTFGDKTIKLEDLIKESLKTL